MASRSEIQILPSFSEPIILCFSVHAKWTVKRQESLAIAKMTARCALCISYSPKFCSRLRPLYVAQILILNEFKLRKFCLFLQEWRFGRSRSSEVTDFWCNRKRVCDFLLVRNSNLGPILHHFGDMTAFMCSWPRLYSTVIFKIVHVGVSQRISLKLFGREIIFEEFQHMWARYCNLKCVTDRQMLYCGNTRCA